MTTQCGFLAYYTCGIILLYTLVVDVMRITHTAAALEVMVKFYSFYVQMQLIESLERKPNTIYVNISSTVVLSPLYSSVTQVPFYLCKCVINISHTMHACIIATVCTTDDTFRCPFLV